MVSLQGTEPVRVGVGVRSRINIKKCKLKSINLRE